MPNIYVSDTAAGKSIRAIAIMKGAREVATVSAAFGNSRVLVNIRQGAEPYLQHSSASGYGYDKFTAALNGLTVDGHELSDHCGKSLKPPRGMKYFPANYKPKRGYWLANYAEYNDAGERVDSYSWTQKAQAEMGEDAEWSDVQQRARELKSAANLTGGYGSCYRESGLDYLKALGYNVITVI